MSALVIQIADAMVSTINGATLSQSVMSTRAYVPVYDLQKDLGALKVTVVPHSISLVNITRSSDDFTYMVDIGVQQLIPKTAFLPDDIMEFCDALMLLMEEIIDIFRGQQLDGLPGVQCMQAANPLVFDPQNIDEERLFFSIATITFKAVLSR